MERERFLSELSEQQVLKESYLQDVEEEEEEGNSRTQKASGITHTSDSLTLEEPHERLRLTLQDLQSQNAMLQEELIFLSNVKTELESNLKHIKEEFMMEREELEFKINELQMMKGDTDTCLEKEVHVLNELKTVSLDKHEQELQKLQELHKTEMKELETRVLCNAEHEKEAIIQELKKLQYQCTVLEEEKNIVISEYEHTKEILSNLELELGDRTADFVNQYSAMKEHAAMSIQELQEKLYEKDSVIKNLKSVAQTSVNSSDKCKEIHITVASDKEHRLENMRTDLDHMVEECKCGQKDTVQLTLKVLEDLLLTLESALAERRSFRSCIAHLEEQLYEKEQTKNCDAILTEQLPLHHTEEQVPGRELQAEALITPNEALITSTEEHTEMQMPNEISLHASEHHSEDERTEGVAVKLHEQPPNEVGTQGTKDDLKTKDDVKSLHHMLNEKEVIIVQLNEEISLLQEFKMSTCNKNMQIEILENEVKEKDERMNKIKAVAVKARKELENSKKEASALREELAAVQAARDKLSDSVKGIIQGAEEYKNLMISYDKQTELLDKEKEKLVGAEKLVEDLTKRLQSAVEQHKQLSSEREDMVAHIETLQSNVRQLEAQALEMQKLKSGLEKDLEAEKITKEQKTKDHQSAVADLEETRALLQKQEQQLQQTEQELEQLRKDAQQSTLLDMEMADYERLVKELNVQLLEKDKLLEKQENLAQAQRDREEKLSQEMESLKSLVDIGEEKNSKMKQLLVKTKKDLADAKKEEASQMMIQSSLKGELEGSLQQLDGYKIQCSELLADRHRLQEQLKSLSDQHLKAVGTFQCNVNTLQEQLSSTKAELCSTVSEFEGYKVRVHNVLKQQKTKSSAPCDGEFSKQEREHMDSMMEQLRSKLQENQLHLQSSTAELQQLQTEHDLLLERHNKMLQQTIAKEAELRERLLTLHSENSALRSEHSQSVAQLTAQADALRSSFREQVHHLQDEQRSTVEMLQQQISRLEAQLFQLQKEPSSTGSAPVQQIRKPLPDRKLADMAVCELQNMAREEGEGMETAEAELVSTSDSAPPTLEQLLSSPDPKQEPFVWQVEPTKDDLSQRLSTATRSLEHMNSLLHESEATNAVLMEQISVLKSELRRLERNQEREKSVANLEYLKNVVLRFMLLPAGSEKQALLPVIHTLLQLSPDEKSKLAAIAQGEEEAAHSGRSGWTSYLHSWSGIR
ncbi:hypothetical protein P4O66_015049 [Electrophorus voltai]|uniref:GRIP domain-containing protein n=1 Tax=Electrophorus voltai TaxID=2609070 RepID=A0AAD8YXI5_9TELE|nr:hypothetical protein P4O66_015049 [Electrophorus voltai]